MSEAVTAQRAVLSSPAKPPEPPYSFWAVRCQLFLRAVESSSDGSLFVLSKTLGEALNDDIILQCSNQQARKVACAVHGEAIMKACKEVDPLLPPQWTPCLQEPAYRDTKKHAVSFVGRNY